MLLCGSEFRSFFRLNKSPLYRASLVAQWQKKKKKSICQCKRYGFDPWSGKTPYAMGQLSPRATTIEPVLKSLGATAAEPTCCNC